MALKITLIILGLSSLLFCQTQVANNCEYWKSQIDPSITAIYPTKMVDDLTDTEVISAIECLLTLEGKKGPSRLAGGTSPKVSEMLPLPSVEIAALYYIEFIFKKKWDHHLGATLVSRFGNYNSNWTVRKSYQSYRKWFLYIQKISLNSARSKQIDPLSFTSGVHWY